MRSVVALGHALDLSVTDEGIETAAQRAYLLDLGCDLGQGYLGVSWESQVAGPRT